MNRSSDRWHIPQVLTAVLLTGLCLLLTGGTAVAAGLSPAPNRVGTLTECCFLPLMARSYVTSPDATGVASIIPGSLTAGSYSTVFVSIVAATTIPAASQVSIGFSHGSDWALPQTQHPGAANYVTVSGPGGADNYDLSVSWRSGRMPFDKRIDVRIRREPVPAGKALWIILGDQSGGGPGTRVQTYAQHAAMIQVEIDTNSDGLWRQVASSPRFDVLPSAPHALVLTAPTDVVSGESFLLQARVEDAYGNLVSGYVGTLWLNSGDSGAQLPSTVSLRPEDGGIAWVENVILTEPGIQPIAASDGRLSGQSNPILVSAIGEPCQHYWGDLHGHSQLSDGLGTPESYFLHGRDVAALDFLALGDHMTLPPEAWATVESLTAQFYEPGRFVTFPSFELSWPYPRGHRNIFLKEEGHAPFDTWQYPELEAYLRSNEAIMIRHHTAKMAGQMATDWSDYLGKLEPLVEVYSGHGNSEYASAPRAVEGADNVGSVQWALALGYRLGIIASTDNHDSHPGNSRWYRGYGGALVSVCAPNLTRDAIWNRLLLRQTYATTGQRILLRFGANGQPMGSEIIVSRDDKPAFVVHVAGTADLARVDLVKGRVGASVPFPATNLLTLRTALRADATQLFWSGGDPHGFDSGAFYYVRVEQVDGEMAWSSPIWIDLAS